MLRNHFSHVFSVQTLPHFPESTLKELGGAWYMLPTGKWLNFFLFFFFFQSCGVVVLGFGRLIGKA
ncbi:hypothetical protein K469DRAFT_165276 [Zopfia rhizophila CBS 207.26]|uniref:Uncharacterized protein n=1 Tax=Zopfia rhizophila CBS 207.26 TaxID=1314779 RepID=A0A6A6E2M5_9PEZI|nr:hypothetical protein K469DRAFT_165276 [Zopfia rhizophila CBS 207.26]